MAKTSDPEKKCENAPPDGVVKEGPEETAHGWPCLISLKRSSPWEEKESQKDSPGLKEKSEEIAASEQNTSKGKDRSLLPCSNKKRKTCTTRLAGIEPKYMWMPLLIPVLFSIFIPGANGLKVYREEGKFRKVFIATNETQIVTDPIEEGPNVGSLFAVFADGGNDRKISFKVDSDFVIDNQSCNIEVGNKNQTECEGLQIFRNGTHIYLAVDGSKLTRDRTEFYIYQQVPQHFSLYVVYVYINYDQDINECASNPCQNGGACVEGLDSFTCNCAKGYDGADCEIGTGSNSTYWKNAFISAAVMAILAIIVILTLVYFLCCKSKSKEQVSPVKLTKVEPKSAYEDDPYEDDPWMSNGFPA